MKNKNFKIAVLSGKGGTGKTLISVNLAAAVKNSVYIDCDVEEPNGYLFLKPEKIEKEEIFVKIPQIDSKLCTVCRHCVDFCKFNALACVENKIIVFEELCHSCGGCMLFCPAKAITEKNKRIGQIERGVASEVTVLTGKLDIGESSGVPIIKELLKKSLPEKDDIFIDCPPGSACLTMESIKDADYCVLVAEPTRFGMYNLEMVYELVELFDKPYGVVLNKCTEEENPSEIFCLSKNIPILGRIPFDSELGSLNSKGEIAVYKNKKYRDLFSDLVVKIESEVQNETVIDFER